MVGVFVCFFGESKLLPTLSSSLRKALSEHLTNVPLLCVVTRLLLSTNVIVNHVKTVVLSNNRLVPLGLLCSLMD